MLPDPTSVVMSVKFVSNEPVSLISGIALDNNFDWFTAVSLIGTSNVAPISSQVPPPTLVSNVLPEPAPAHQMVLSEEQFLQMQLQVQHLMQV